MICSKCGTANAKPVQLFDVRTQAVASQTHLCEQCFQAVMSIADEHDKEFESMLARGVSRDDANRVCIARFERATDWRPADN